MKIIQPSVELYQQGTDGFNDIYKQIERIGRICYKSEEKIGEGTAQKFVEMLEKRNHGAMLEHGTMYLTFTEEEKKDPLIKGFLNILRNDRFITVAETKDNYTTHGSSYVTMNYRSFILLKKCTDLSFLDYKLKDNFYNQPHEHHSKRFSIKFITNRGVTHEAVRNRGLMGNSFAQESTRYVNYAKNDEINFIQPYWWNEKPEWQEATIEDNTKCEQSYFKRIEMGQTPQQARGCLNNDLKTELVITAHSLDWADFFRLRCDAAAHPDMQIVAKLAQQLLGDSIDVIDYIDPNKSFSPVKGDGK